MILEFIFFCMCYLFKVAPPKYVLSLQNVSNSKYVCKTKYIKNILKAIPKKEKYVLEAFLYDLISLNQGSYVIFGDKPGALMLLQEEEDFCYDHTFPYWNSFLSRKGFALWQKYFSSCPSHYAMIKIKATNNRTLLLFIHKQRIYDLIEQEWNEFKKAFPEFHSVESFHQAILNDTSILSTICFKHEMLLGILLGFGKESAALFARESELIEGAPLPFKRLTPSLGFTSLKEELEAIGKKGGSVLIPEKEPAAFYLHLPVGYLVDTTKVNLGHLRNRYRKQLHRATLAYKKGNYLNVTLQELLSNSGGKMDDDQRNKKPEE